MELKRIDNKLTAELFHAFGSSDMLLTAGNREGCNTMTVGWCQMGCVWGMDTCSVYIRQERHTRPFMDNNDYFTLSILPTKQLSLSC